LVLSQKTRYARKALLELGVAAPGVTLSAAILEFR